MSHKCAWNDPGQWLALRVTGRLFKACVGALSGGDGSSGLSKKRNA